MHKQSDKACCSTGQQHGDMLEVQQQPHWQQQPDEAITPEPPSRAPPPQAPSTPQLQRPAYYPDPEPGLCCHGFGSLQVWAMLSAALYQSPDSI